MNIGSPFKNERLGSQCCNRNRTFRIEFLFHVTVILLNWVVYTVTLSDQNFISTDCRSTIVWSYPRDNHGIRFFLPCCWWRCWLSWFLGCQNTDDVRISTCSEFILSLNPKLVRCSLYQIVYCVSNRLTADYLRHNSEGSPTWSSVRLQHVRRNRWSSVKCRRTPRKTNIVSVSCSNSVSQLCWCVGSLSG